MSQNKYAEIENARNRKNIPNITVELFNRHLESKKLLKKPRVDILTRRIGPDTFGFQELPKNVILSDNVIMEQEGKYV